MRASLWECRLILHPVLKRAVLCVQFIQTPLWFLVPCNMLWVYVSVPNANGPTPLDNSHIHVSPWVPSEIIAVGGIMQAHSLQPWEFWESGKPVGTIIKSHHGALIDLVTYVMGCWFTARILFENVHGCDTVHGIASMRALSQDLRLCVVGNGVKVFSLNMQGLL